MSKYKKFFQDNRKVILMAAAILIISFFLFLNSDTDHMLKSNYEIERDTYDGQRKTALVNISIGDSEYEDVEIQVNHREYTEESLHTFFIESHDLIKDRLGINTGKGFVSEDLVFDEALPDSPLYYEWFPQDKTIVDDMGKILTPDEVITSVEVVASYGEWSESCIFEFRICPSREVQNRYVKERIESLISLEEEKSRTEDKMTLPGEIDGIRLDYFEKNTGRNYSILLGGIILSLLLVLAFIYDKKSEKDKRKNEIVGEYPIVIQKLVMYISAGMTVRNAWTRICENSRQGGNKNLIYEEMIITENEIQTGVSEAEAYEAFGKRINDNSIIRFTTLLSQNIRKGSTSLSSLLREESERAFEFRINRARKRGEEASTKLLLPMTLLLIIVTVIIMLPAFGNL